MDQFEKNLVNSINLKNEVFANEVIKPETVTLDRIINFYAFVEKNNWHCSIIFFHGKTEAWIDTGNGLFNGVGATINDALNDLIEVMK